MNMRRVLNVAWTLACEGLDADGIEKLRRWLYATPEKRDPAKEAEEERKRKAQENKQSAADLAKVFAMGG